MFHPTCSSETRFVKIYSYYRTDMPRSSHIPCEMCSSRSLRSLYVTMLLRALLAWQSRLDHRSALGTGVGHGGIGWVPSFSHIRSSSPHWLPFTRLPTRGRSNWPLQGLLKQMVSSDDFVLCCFGSKYIYIYAFVYKFHSFSSIYLYIILI